MSSRLPRYHLRATLALAVFLQLGTACDQWHLSVNGDGLVFISVISDDSQPRDRFRVRTRQSNGTVRVVDVPASGRLTLSPAVDGVVELTLLTPDKCHVEGSNPRTLTVDADREIRVAFDVRCSG